MSIVLQRDRSALDGLTLSWTVSNMDSLIELTLIYFKNETDADIHSMDLDPRAVSQNLQNMESGVEYTFQLQAVDRLRTVYSNLLLC